MPDFSFENKLLKHEQEIICGIDEVGRGPLAGPVVANALIFKSKPPHNLLNMINDSKALSVKKREYLVATLTQYVIYGMGQASVIEIDKYNILQATLIAMKRAYSALQKIIQPNYVIIDGNKNLQLEIPSYTLIKGDSKSITIACASIFAKVYRDNLMQELAVLYPQYNWQKNAGYGTKEHLIAMSNYGVTEHHRSSFKPVNLLKKPSIKSKK